MAELVQNQSSDGGLLLDGTTYIKLAERAKRDGVVIGGDRAARRALAGFFRPHDLESHTHLVRAMVASDGEREVAQLLAECRGGIVMIHRHGQAISSAPAPSPSSEAAELTPVRSHELAASDWPEKPAEALIRPFELSAEDGSPVNIGPFSNHHVAEALHGLAFSSRPVSGYRVRFQDGSVSQPLTLPVAESPETAVEPERRLRVALLSHRHLALDHRIDVNWFRNAEVSTGDPHTTIERRCAEVTEQQLRAYTEDPLTIELEQTGFLPAVVGFYRGLLSVIEADRGSFEVRVEVSGKTLWWR